MWLPLNYRTFDWIALKFLRLPWNYFYNTDMVTLDLSQNWICLSRNYHDIGSVCLGIIATMDLIALVLSWHWMWLHWNYRNSDMAATLNLFILELSRCLGVMVTLNLIVLELSRHWVWLPWNYRTFDQIALEFLWLPWNYIDTRALPLSYLDIVSDCHVRFIAIWLTWNYIGTWFYFINVMLTLWLIAMKYVSVDLKKSLTVRSFLNG